MLLFSNTQRNIGQENYLEGDQMLVEGVNQNFILRECATDNIEINSYFLS
jgi:hypothetical protein